MRVTYKLTLALVTGIVVVHTGSAVVRVSREMELFRREFARDEQVLGRSLAHAVAKVWATHGEQAALELIRYTTEREIHIEIRWVELDATRDATRGALSDRVPEVPTEELAPLRAGKPVVVRHGEGHGALYTYVPVDVPGVVHGAIEIINPLVDEQEYMYASIRNAVVAAGALVALCALLAWGLGAGLIGRPVRELVEQARRIGGGDLEQRLALTSRDEIGELGREMDAMCEQLERAQAELHAETRSRIEAIEQLRHVDRLKTVGTLASGVAHELGTPINVIAGHAQLIREDRGVSAEVIAHTDVVSRQCARMTAIIRQLLDFARRGGGAQASADLGEVARETLKMVEPLARRRGVATSLAGVDAPARVKVGFDEVQQAVTNIVINGLHAMPEGGALSLRVTRARTAPPGDGEEPDDFLCMCVEDTGTGMDDETRQRIFEPFFTTKDVGQGTGLGLSVAHGIVHDNGGWIEVASDPGRGSRFSIYLPAERQR